MRIAKLLGALFFVTGLFVFTRGTGWHWRFMLAGSVLGFISLLLLSARRPQRFRRGMPQRPKGARRARQLRPAVKPLLP
jgi:hypothetical protein